MPEVGDILGGMEVVGVTTLSVRYREVGRKRVYRLPMAQWWRWHRECRRIRCSQTYSLVTVRKQVND